MLVLFALAIPVMLGMSALVIDFGNLFVQKRSLQQDADAAALAGTSKLPCPDFAYGLDVSNPVAYQCWSDAATRAAQYSSANGGPPISGVCADSSATNCIEGQNGTKLRVRFNIPISTLFGGIFGQKFVNVGAKPPCTEAYVLT